MKYAKAKAKLEETLDLTQEEDLKRFVNIQDEYDVWKNRMYDTSYHLRMLGINVK